MTAAILTFSLSESRDLERATLRVSENLFVSRMLSLTEDQVCLKRLTTEESVGARADISTSLPAWSPSEGGEEVAHGFSVLDTVKVDESITY